jgi:hypothetical protein
MNKLIASSIAALAIGVVSAHAATIAFDLQGKAGAGLLPGNENGTVGGNAGTGGELPGGIFYDDVTNLLTMNIGWGSGNGFTDLTGNTTGGHLHGPTTSPAPGSFLQDASVKYPLNNLPEWNPSATNGSFQGTISILEADEPGLLAGEFYFNVHTTANGGGEARGNLVQAVPEPGSFGLVAFGALALLGSRRRCRI